MDNSLSDYDVHEVSINHDRLISLDTGRLSR